MNISELHRSVFDLRFSLALMFFIRLGLFDLLKGDWLTIAQMEKSLHIKEGRLQAVIDVLLAHGVVIKNQETYRLPDDLAPAFSDDSPESIRNLLVFDSCNLHKWVQLERTFFEDGSFGPEPISIIDVFRKAMEERVLEMQERVADIVVTHMKDSVADVGCGPGTAVECILRKNDSARCYLIDSESVLETTALRLRRTLGERESVRFVPVDFLRDRIPVQASVVLTSRVLMGYVGDRLDRVLEHLVSALEPDGMLVVNEFDPDTKIGSLMSLDMLVNAGTIIQRKDQYARLLERWGVKLTSRIPTSGFTHALCFTKY